MSYPGWLRMRIKVVHLTTGVVQLTLSRVVTIMAQVLSVTGDYSNVVHWVRFRPQEPVA